MFETLFAYPAVAARHRAGPLTDAREQYLAHCAGYGAARATLLSLADELLVVAERINIRGAESISAAQVRAAADSWSRYQRRRGRAHGGRWSRERFIQVATAWLRFLGWLESPADEPKPFAAQVEDFIAYLRNERGLSPSSLKANRWHVQCFLQTSLKDKDSIAQITTEDIDGFLSLKGTQGWCRVSVAKSATVLRSFFDMPRCVSGVLLGSPSPSMVRDYSRTKDFPPARSGMMSRGSSIMPQTRMRVTYATGQS